MNTVICLPIFHVFFHFGFFLQHWAQLSIMDIYDLSLGDNGPGLKTAFARYQLSEHG